MSPRKKKWWDIQTLYQQKETPQSPCYLADGSQERQSKSVPSALRLNKSVPTTAGKLENTAGRSAETPTDHER